MAAARAALEERVLGQMLHVDDLITQADSIERALVVAEQAWAEREALLIAEMHFQAKD